MKITPQQYAQVLIASMKDGNVSDVAKSFWRKLQKNGQYKDLSKIMNTLDKEYAKANDKVLAEIYSEKELSNEQIKSLEQKIAKEYSSNDSKKFKTDSSHPAASNNKIIIRNIIKKDITGIIIKVNGTEINLSLESKVNRLKNAFSKL